MYVDPALISWTVDVATATRRPREHGLDEVADYISYGASPRGPISLVAAGRALALMRGRDYVVPADLEELVRDAFRHRLVLSLPRARRRGRAGRDPRPGAGGGARCRSSTSGARHAAGVSVARPARTDPDARRSRGRARSRRRRCARSSWRSAGASTGCSRATTARRSPASAASSGRFARTSPATTCAGSSGTSTARTGEPHVRVELAERVLVSWLVARRVGVDGVRHGRPAQGRRRRRRRDRGRLRGDAARQPARASSRSAPSRAVDPPRQGRVALIETLRLLREVPPAGTGSLRRRARADRPGRAPAVAGRHRLRLSRPARLAAGAAAARRPAHGARGRGARSARAGARRRRRAAARRSRRAAASFASTRATARLRERFAAAARGRAPQPRRDALASAGVRHVALSTEGDWLRPLAAFLRRSEPRR